MNDAKYKKLGELGFVGTLNERYIQWLQSLGATATDVSSAERQELSLPQSAGKTNQDIRSAFYGGSGSLNDKEFAFWRAYQVEVEPPGPPPAPPPPPLYTPIAGFNVSDNIAGSQATSRLLINRDGTWQIISQNGTGVPSPSGVQNWITPTGTNPGDTHWVRLTPSSSSFSGAASNTWHQLNTQRLFEKGGTTGALNAVGRIEIATDSAGTNIVSAGAVGSLTLGYTHDAGPTPPPPPPAPSFKTIENIVAVWDPNALNNTYTLNNQPEVVVPTTSRVANGATTYSSIPYLRNISEAGEIFYDGEYRFRKKTVGGRLCYELAHEAGDPTYSGGIRNEIGYFFASPPERTFPWREEFWGAFDFMLPDRASGDPSKIIAQWHQSGPTQNPYFAFYQNGNNFQVAIRYNDQASPTQATNVVYQANVATLPPAGTHCVVVINAKCSPFLADNPFIKVWLNDVLVVDRSGTNGRCGYNQNNTRFEKAGVYAFGGMTSGTRRTVDLFKGVYARLPAVGNYTQPDLVNFVTT